MKQSKTIATTYDHFCFLRDVIDKANKILKPLHIKLEAKLPKRLPRGGAVFVPIPVKLFLRCGSKQELAVLDAFNLTPVVAEIESIKMRPVFTLHAIEEALKIFAEDRADRRERAKQPLEEVSQFLL